MERNRLDHWCDAAVKQLRFPPDRAAVWQELWDHLQDRQADFQEQGQSAEEAEASALQAMGDAVAVGKELNRVHRPWLGWLWVLSKTAVILAAVVLLVLLVMGRRMDVSNPFMEENKPWACARLAAAFPGLEQDYVPVETGAVRQAGTYTLTLDHGYYYDDGRRQEMAVCFRADAQWFFDQEPIGLREGLLAEDNLGNQYNMKLNVFEQTYYSLDCSTRSGGAQLVGVYAVLCDLYIWDKIERQWFRFYVPGTDFSVTVRTNGEVIS